MAGTAPGPKPEEIDALLDQVENKYLNCPEAKKLSEIPPKDCPCTVKHPTDWKEVDEMLKDFKFEDNNPFSKSKNKPWARQKIPPPAEVAMEDKNSIKCFTVYLSGSYEVMGACVPGAEKPCDNLKCLRCDFSVIAFDNFSWHSSTDYLFLRNNMPDYERLASKLYKKKGYRAYACQCRHTTVNNLVNILSRPEVRWICGRHSRPNTDNPPISSNLTT